MRMSNSLGTEILQTLQKMGSDLTQKHSFDFYLYLPTEPIAQAAAERVRKGQFSTEVVPGANGNNWLCKATIRILPEEARLDEIGGFFDRIAFELNGDFDGWESDFIKKVP